jgi:tRNA threonylcarbamoyladenosine biosynthesis protein TsaE
MPSIPSGQFTTNSAEETFELASSIGRAIEDSTVLLLHGELGVGKTVFAKGIAAGLEIDPADVNSPTFTIINQHDGRVRLYHIDLYRIDGREEEIRELGLEEMLTETDTVIVIEWAERLGKVVIANSCQVKISDLGGESRSFCIVCNK